MSASEIAVITNSSGSPAWFEIADAGHSIVQFVNSGGRVSDIAVGDTEPTVGIPVTSGHRIKIEQANTKVWAKLYGENSITVMRGDALLTDIAQ